MGQQGKEAECGEKHIFSHCKSNCSEVRDIAQEGRPFSFLSYFSPQKDSKKFVSTSNAYLYRG